MSRVKIWIKKVNNENNFDFYTPTTSIDAGWGETVISNKL